MDMHLITGFIAGFILGALILFLTFRGKDRELELLKQSHEEALKQQRAFLETRLKDHEQNENKIKDQFSIVATEVLAKNLEAQIKALKNENSHDLDKKKQEFNQSFDEVKSHLKNASEHIQIFEKERTDQYAKIQKQIETLSTQEQKLIQETERLKSALTTSQSVRGRWGELVLRNILAQSDLVSGIDFEEQSVSSGMEGNQLKPDFVIKLPQSGQHLVIDSKASLFESYLESENVSTEASRLALHQDFAKRLRSRVADLSSKEYQKHVTDSLPYVVLFVPSEAAIRAAFDVDGELFKWAMDRKVFLSSPATILPLIMLIAHGWKQNKLSERANELSLVVSELGKRLDLFVGRLSRVQSGIDQASKAWNEAIDKSWYGNQSVQKSIDKARELGGNLPDIKPLPPLEHQLRLIEDKE
jgi:DNA recombination protein RmuC